VNGLDDIGARSIKVLPRNTTQLVKNVKKQLPSFRKFWVCNFHKNFMSLQAFEKKLFYDSVWAKRYFSILKPIKFIKFWTDSPVLPYTFLFSKSCAGYFCKTASQFIALIFALFARDRKENAKPAVLQVHFLHLLFTIAGFSAGAKTFFSANRWKCVKLRCARSRKVYVKRCVEQ